MGMVGTFLFLLNIASLIVIIITITIITIIIIMYNHRWVLLSVFSVIWGVSYYYCFLITFLFLLLLPLLFIFQERAILIHTINVTASTVGTITIIIVVIGDNFPNANSTHCCTH